MAEDALTQAATAARAGDLESLTAILADSPSATSATDADGRTLLDLACRAATGDIAIPRDPGTRQQHAAVDMILAAGPVLLLVQLPYRSSTRPWT